MIAGVKDKPIDYLFKIFNYTFFILFTIICFFPFYYLFINTISDNNLISRGKILLYPQGIHFTNYIQVIQLQGIGRAALVSISRTVLGTLLACLGSSFLAYIVMQEKLYGRKFWYRFIVITMYFNAGLIPAYLNIKRLGLINSFFVYIIPGLVIPYYVILMRTYIQSLPNSLQESAKIDGAGYLRIYLSIIIPLSIPILATLAIFSAVGQWNAYLDTLYYITKPQLYTLQYLLYNYLNELDSLARLMANNPNAANIDPDKLLTPTSIRWTVSMVVILPIFLVYPFGQKYFLKGIMMGAVKG